MKKIPRRIDVMGHPITVTRRNIPDAFGEFWIDDESGKARIALDKGMDSEYSEKILFHELVHAVLHFSGAIETLSEEQEEAIVRAMEHGLFPLYQRK